MIAMPLWMLLGLVLVLAAAWRQARTWLLVVAVLCGLYLGSTSCGQAATGIVNRVVHPSVSTSTR
jgi:hypothetical protein